MPNRLKPLNLVDFTGGVNLRPEAFQLLENELPVLLNLEVDPRGGLNTRKGWKHSTPTPVTTETWNPHNAYTMRYSTGVPWTYVASGNKLFGRGSGSWTQIATNCLAAPHMADFAAWGDTMYVARGKADTIGSFRVNQAGPTALTPSGAANWANDYTNPGAATFPRSELVATHMGYMFTANVKEDSTEFPCRLRWSHPNNPLAWAKDDYIDILEGGQSITAVIPFNDRLLVFKPDSVWALFGYDADTWDMANVSQTVGCANQQLVCRSEDAVYFLSWPHGVFSYTTTQVQELSVQIRTIFNDQWINPNTMSSSFIGWVGRRLWVSLAYSGDIPLPTDAATAFVFDPVLSSWTMFQGGGGGVPGPYIERTETDDVESQLAVNRKVPYAMTLDAMPLSASDETQPGLVTPFATTMRTRWLDAGAPTWKKSWRRPDFLLRGMTVESTVNCQVFHDFDNSNAERSFIVSYSPDNVVARWTSNAVSPGFKYGDGTLYGGSKQSSSVERGGTMGRAGTIQLSLTGFPGVQWGLNGIVFKYIPRRFR
jgi:hypothetical protein